MGMLADQYTAGEPHAACASFREQAGSPGHAAAVALWAQLGRPGHSALLPPRRMPANSRRQAAPVGTGPTAAGRRRRRTAPGRSSGRRSPAGRPPGSGAAKAAAARPGPARGRPAGRRSRSGRPRTAPAGAQPPGCPGPPWTPLPSWRPGRPLLGRPAAGAAQLLQQAMTVIEDPPAGERACRAFSARAHSIRGGLLAWTKSLAAFDRCRGSHRLL